MQISAGGRHFSWRFLQVKVAFSIIGADFLANFKMAVDLSGMQLLCPSGLKIRCLVEGRAFTLYTDHNPLTDLLAKQADAWSA